MRRNMINPRRMRKLAYLSYLLGVFFIVVSLALSAGVAPATANEASSINMSPLQGPGNCGDWDAKVENGPPWTYTSPNGELIQKVTIKAGSQQTGEACFPFSYPPSTQENDCYRVTGLGTTSVTATDIGGSECKAISHIEIYFMDATPTATTPPPTPTDTNTPPPTPTDTNTPTPTDTNTPTPTDTNTPTPTDTNTPTPTDTDTPTPTDTNTPGPTPTDTNTPTPTDTNTPGPSPTNTNTPEEPTPTDTTSPEPPDTETPTPTDTATVEPTPTDTEEPEPTDTTVPTLPPPTREGTSDILIPVTGIDLSFQQSVMVRILSNVGLMFFGIGIVLHGLSLRMRDED